jgi:hypothetical protein
MLMSFTDPLSITISGSTIPLPRTSVGDDESEYTSSDGLVQVKSSHTYGKRTRRMLRVDTSKVAPDPFRPSENVKVSMSTYIVFDLPPAGYTATEAKAVFDGFRAMFAATSDQQITKLLGGES